MPLTGADRLDPPVDPIDGIDIGFASTTGVLLSVNDPASNGCDGSEQLGENERKLSGSW